MSFFHPPGFNCLLLLIGIYYWLRSNGWMAAIFLLGGLISLYVLSTPIASNYLLTVLQANYSQIKLSELAMQRDVKAIVVLAPLNSADNLSTYQYTAAAAKATGLPLLVTGNNYLLSSSLEGSTTSVEKMAKSLAKDFGVTGAIWIEKNGLSIKDNASLSKKILDQNGIKKILLVTQGYSIKKADAKFKAKGISVIPAPIVNNKVNKEYQLRNFIPRAECLMRSSTFFYMLLEGFWGNLFGLLADNTPEP
jgi:uncharacterized SAM-binding protein YcdF (DUF218 family)